MSGRSRTASPRSAASFGFAVQVSMAGPAGRASKISVESELTRLGLPGMVLRSSDRRAPLISGQRWPAGVRWSIDDRLREPGARKGRVLAIWQGDQVIAACCWHLHETGPPVILDLGCREDLDQFTRKVAATALMLCLRQIAGARGLHRDMARLRWPIRLSIGSRTVGSAIECGMRFAYLYRSIWISSRDTAADRDDQYITIPTVKGIKMEGPETHLRPIPTRQPPPSPVVQVMVRCGAPDSPPNARRRGRSRSWRHPMPGFVPDASEFLPTAARLCARMSQLACPRCHQREGRGHRLVVFRQGP
jgi:hypothetical protein